MVNLGWAIAREGDFERGRHMMRTGIELFTKTGARIQMSCWTGMLADVHVEAGYLGEGLSLLDEALDWVKRTGEKHYLSELHRIRGTALYRRDGAGSEAAQAAFRDAINVALEQGAVMRELRAGRELAEVLAESGRSGEARGLLDEIIGRIPEPQESADSLAAHALRDRL